MISSTRFLKAKSAFMEAEILSQPCMTVVWSRPPKVFPMLVVESVVIFRQMYIATWRGSTIVDLSRAFLDTNGARAYRTKGDANNTIDTVPTKPENIIGLYVSRVPKIGAFIYFLQKPWGMAIFIGVPVLAFIIYDIIRRQRSAKREDNKVEALEEELKRLRELAGKQNGGGDPPDAGN